MQSEKLTPPRAIIQGWACDMSIGGAREGMQEFVPFHKEGLVPWLHFAGCHSGRVALSSSFNSSLGKEGDGSLAVVRYQVVS